jgi:hypothetical protein
MDDDDTRRQLAMPRLLTEVQAFQAMRTYLSRYPAALEGIGEIGPVLSEMDLLRDGNPADPAIWWDWLDVIEEIALDEGRMRFSEIEAMRGDMLDEALVYRAAYVFLYGYTKRETHEKKILEVLQEIEPGSDGLPLNATAKERWQAAVRDAATADISRKWIDPPEKPE